VGFKLSQEINPVFPGRREDLVNEAASERRFKRGEPSSSSVISAPTRVAQKSRRPGPGLPTGMKNGESIDSLRSMILGELEGQYTGHQEQYVSEHRASRNLSRLILTTDQEDTSPLTAKWLAWVSTARSLRSHVLAS
jgi:hypothetical protein